MQIWLHGFPVPGTVAPLAARTEQQGFHGLLLADSQVLVGDPYVECALAAAATTTLHVGVAVTNPVTRHPSVTASSVLTVHVESGGRAVLGMARGDSALRQIGERPAGVDRFASALADIQAYLGAPDSGSDVGSIAWLPEDLPKVPVDVAATGPTVIALGATVADRLTFNLGADPQRLAWAVGVARAARRDAGLDPEGISLGAYVDVACHRDAATAVDQVRGSASIFVQFLAEGLHAGVPVGDDDRRIAEQVAEAYSEAAHGSAQAPQAQLLPADFLERFAVVGPPEVVRRRIAGLGELGLDRVVIVPASRDVAPADVAAGTELFAREVLAQL